MNATKTTGIRTASFFGRLVQVSAPAEIWEQAWIECAEELGRFVEFDEFREEADGTLWGVNKGVYDGGDQMVELFLRAEDESRLEMVQQGYIPIRVKGSELWVWDEDIGRVES